MQNADWSDYQLCIFLTLIFAAFSLNTGPDVPAALGLGPLLLFSLS